MSSEKSGQGGLSGTVAVEIVPLASTPPLLKDAHKFKQTLLGPLQVPGAIVSNLALNGYITLADLDYFGHKDLEDFCSTKIRQALNPGGPKYSKKVIKRLQGLVWRAS